MIRFSDENGSLHTGKIALCLFAGILVITALIFQVRQPAQEVLLEIEHVFSSEESSTLVEKEKVTINDEQNTEEASHQVSNNKTPVKPIVDLKKIAVQATDEDKGDNVSSGKQNEVGDGEKIDLLRDNFISAATANNQGQLQEQAEDPIPKVIDLDISEALSTLSGKEKVIKILPQEAVQQKIKLAEHGQPGEMQVQSDSYLKVYQAWMQSGKGLEESNGLIPLQVENLENTYNYFHMKLVAVVNDRYIDLEDGAVMSHAALEDYSATVFVVDEPWHKLAAKLQGAGLHKEQEVQVRYYLYPAIRNAIFSRAQQAFTWCRQNNYIPADTAAADVDVRGRTFIIRQEGGGAFGVFVPTVLKTKDGAEVAITADCFTGQSDVRQLQKSGLL